MAWLNAFGTPGTEAYGIQNEDSEASSPGLLFVCALPMAEATMIYSEIDSKKKYGLQASKETALCATQDKAQTKNLLRPLNYKSMMP